MTEIIKLLEKMGSDATIQTTEEIQTLIENSSLDNEQQEHLINQDSISIERQLDVCPDIYCVIFPAEDDEPSENEEPIEDSNINLVANL